MLKLNLNNLNGILHNGTPQQEEKTPEPAMQATPVRRYSAYRTVINRHEELSKKLDGMQKDGTDDA